MNKYNMNIFITGGTGFLGKVTIKNLIKNGYNVFALVRSENSKNIALQLGAVPVFGDINNLNSNELSLKDIDTVIHCAAPVEFKGPWINFEKQILQATLNLAKIAIEQNVKNFIHISSESVLQGNDDLVNINEEYEYPQKCNSFYGEAKKLAEKSLLSLNSSMRVIILRPTFIYGEGCPSLIKILEKAKSNQFPWINNGESFFEAVHVENVAQAISLAITNGKNNSIYTITDNVQWTVRTFFENIFKKNNIKISQFSIPKYLLYPIAFLIDFIWNKFNLKIAPPLSLFELAFISQSRRYNISKAVSELMYSPKKFIENK